MPAKNYYGFSASPELKDRIEKAKTKLEKKTHMIVSTAAFVRLLCERGLDMLGKK